MAMPWNSGALRLTLPLGKQAAVRRATAKSKIGILGQLRFNVSLKASSSSLVDGGPEFVFNRRPTTVWRAALYFTTHLYRNSDGLQQNTVPPETFFQSASL